jgi:hypothetical protein
MKFSRPDLHQDRDDENHTENSRSDKVACALRLRRRFAEPRHGDRVARGFAERCGEDLNNPKQNCYLRYLGNEFRSFFVHFWLRNTRCRLAALLVHLQAGCFTEIARATAGALLANENTPQLLMPRRLE